MCMTAMLPNVTFQEEVYRSVVTYGLLQTVLHRYHANNTLLTTAWDKIQAQVGQPSSIPGDGS